MYDNQKFKNVLILNNYSMFEANPVGITLQNIFNEWPDNRLFEIFRYSTTRLELNKIKIKSFRLPAGCLPIDNIIRKIAHKEIAREKKPDTFHISLDKRLSINQRIKIAGKYLSESLFMCNKNSKIYKELEKYNPQVIYTIGESLFTLKASLYFSKKFNIPVVVHYMDNWRETIYPPELKIINYLFSLNLKKIERKMKHGLVISPKMKEEYSLNNNITYSVLLNSVELPLESVRDTQYNNTQKNIIFTYIGGLHLNRWESLLEIEKCILELNEKGIAAKLNIYTPDPDKTNFQDKFNNNVTVFKGFLPHDKISQAYQAADILVHVESFHNQVINYTKYSLSTKIPECMATGKPILCYAPGYLAVAEYINNTRAGISTDNYTELLKAATQLSIDEEYRNDLGKHGIDTVINSHTKQKALKTLMESL